MDSTIKEIEKRITAIELRNKMVEQDKAWETSTSRKFLLMVFTYAAIGFYMYTIDVNNPWLNAVIPTTGFWLSTLSLPFFRTLWHKWLYSKK